MPREGYIRELRAHVGSRPLLLPSVAALVRDADRVLVGRHRDVGRWVIPGGALEPGERPIDGLVREVWEETGLLVSVAGVWGVYGGGADHRIHYPNGDIVDYVVAVFECDVAGGVLHEATDELDALQWVTLAELATLDTPPWLTRILDHPGWEPLAWSPPSPITDPAADS